MKKCLLSRTECNAMRGIAIIAIIVHNYCHRFGSMPSENEFIFSTDNVTRMLHCLGTLDGLFPLQLFSFFGHYGVAVFIFLSAYGLVLKYESQTAATHDAGAFAFIRYHFLKLFRIMAVGFVAFAIFDITVSHTNIYQPGYVVAELCMVANLLPQAINWIITPGPYWFFGLLLQFYVVYRLLLYRRSSKAAVALMIVCIIPEFFFPPVSAKLYMWKFNFVGHVLPFVIGLLAARGQLFNDKLTSLLNQTKVALVVLAVSIVGTVVFSLQYFLWILSPFFVVVGSIALVKLLKGRLLELIAKVGEISAAIFVVHPLAREMFISLGESESIYLGLAIYLIVTFAFAWLFIRFMRIIPKPKLTTK